MAPVSRMPPHRYGSTPFFRQVASAVLIIQLTSSVLPGSWRSAPLSTPAARAADPESDATGIVDIYPEMNRLGTETSDIQVSIRKLLRRARHPGAPGSDGGKPTPSEVAAVESRLQTLGRELDTWFAAPSSPTPGEKIFLWDEVKLRLLSAHFNLLTALINLEISLGRDYGRAFIDRFSLQVPLERISMLQGLGKAVRGQLGESFYGLNIDRGGNGAAETIRITLADNIIHGLELGQTTGGDPTSEKYITMVRYLTVRQLLQNLNTIKTLKRVPELASVTIPEALTTKLPSLGLSGNLLAEQEKAALEPLARLALGEAFSDIESSLPVFADDSLTVELARAIATTPQTQREIREAMKSLLERSRLPAFRTLIDGELMMSSLPLSTLTLESLAESMRRIIHQTETSRILARFQEMMSEGTLSIPMHVREKVMTILDTHAQKFGKKISTALLLERAKKARQISKDRIYTARREALVSDLIGDAVDFERSEQELRREHRVDLAALVRSRSGDIGSMNPSPRLVGWFAQITRAGNWNQARDAYAEVASSQTSSEILVNGLVHPALLERWIEKNRDSLAPKLPFSNSDINTHLSQSLQSSRIKDLQDLRKTGELLGFHKILPTNHPGVADLIKSSEQLSTYRTALRDGIRDRHPILGTEVTWTGKKLSLAAALLESNPDRISDDETWAQAESLIDQAIEKSEARIRSLIQKAGSAKTLKEISVIAESSLNMELVMSIFPQLGHEQNRALEDLARHSLSEQFFHGKIGGYLSWGFGALMLVQATGFLIKPARPFTEAITWGLDPLIKGYMASAIPLVMADTVYQWEELKKKESRLEFSRDIQAAFPLGGSLVEAAAVDALRKDYEWNKWFFYGRVALDTLCMYLPEGYHLVTKVGQKLALREAMADMDAFRILGLEVGNWAGVTRAQADAMTRKVILVPDAVAEIEMAHARLLSKVQSGRTWDPRTAFTGEIRMIPQKTRSPDGREIEELIPVLNAEPVNPIERRIWRALQAESKGAR